MNNTKGVSMKSYIQTFTELYDALAQDIVSQYPSIKSEMERDLSRLHFALTEEGGSFITITQLDQCAYFRRSLAVGAMLDLPSKPRPRGFGRKSSVDARPSYLWGLLATIFDEDGKLLTDPDVTAIAFVHQWLLMAKKLEADCEESRTEATLSEFLAIEARMPDHHPGTWDLDDPDWARRVGHPLWGRSVSRIQETLGIFPGTPEDDVDWDLYRQICDRISTVIGVFDPWSARPKHGPGAVADVGNPLKYDFTSWPRKLQQYFPWDFFGSHDFGLTQRMLGREPDSREFPSVVLCVPKTQKGPRIICKEPIAHQWMQGAVERFLVKRVNDTALSLSISFKDQSASQQMALDASHEGELSTVDLSAASDRISTRLVEYLFSKEGETSLLDALHASRSRWFVLSGQCYRFRKFAPMGSACTFPIQTILFLSFALLAVLQTRGKHAREWMDVLPEIRVFGDDIIIPTDSIPVLYAALSSAGLKVNEDKSFSTGLFRESCGMDAYAGWDVSPAYIKQLYSSSNPSSLQAVVDTANNFFAKGYWHTAAALIKTVPVAERKLLPIRDIRVFEGDKGDGAVSLSSFCGDDHSHLSSRFNEDLHRIEHSSILLSTKSTREVSDGAAGLIQFFTEEPEPDSKYESGQVRRSTTRKSRRWV